MVRSTSKLASLLLGDPVPPGRPDPFCLQHPLSAAILLIAALGSGCTGAPADGPDGLYPAPREERSATSGVAPADAARNVWFTEHAEASGLSFAHINGMSGEFYFPEMIPAGVGVFDYDNDGDLDVYLVQGRMLVGGGAQDDALERGPSQGSTPLGGRLFQNDLYTNAAGTRWPTFIDVTTQSGIHAPGYGMGVATADVTNDGCPELYLTHFGANQLFLNNCDGTFTDVSETSGTADTGWGVSASFLDYDRDGWLDLYVGNYVQYQIQTDLQCTGLTGRRDYCTPDVYTPQVDRLYRNQGDGRFTDVTATALIGGRFGPALGVSTADFDGDGWIDIYVANDLHSNLLWLNQRDGTFEERGLLAAVALSSDGETEASMGVDAGDFDNDGDADLFVTHLPVEGNNLYRNDGQGRFEEVSIRSGLGPMSRGHTGFATAWFDADNDGWLDLLAVNGAIEAIDGRGDDPFPYDERNLLFHNLRDGRFADVTDEAGSAFELSDVSRGAAFGDLDNDGDTDIVVSNNNGPARLFVNEIGHESHWLV